MYKSGGSSFKKLLINLPLFSDPRGDLFVAELQKQLPFGVNRIFIVCNVPANEIRGEHAHRECHQLLVCVKGSVHAVVDNGVSKEEFYLDSPAKGLYLPPMTWGGQFNYSQDAVLLVLASHQYSETDYIRNYSHFLDIVRSF